MVDAILELSNFSLCRIVIRAGIASRNEQSCGVRHFAEWQVNEVNIVVKCFNRFPIPKLKVLKKYDLWIGNLLKQFTTTFTCQSQAAKKVSFTACHLGKL